MNEFCDELGEDENREVLDPYRPDSYDEDALVLKNENSDKYSLYFIDVFLLGPIAAIIAAFFALVFVAMFGLDKYGYELIGGAPALTLGSALAFCTADAIRKTQWVKRMRALSEVTEVKTSGSMRRPMLRLADALRALPAAQREEFRKIWAEALDANAYVNEVGYDGGAFTRVQDRAEAVEAFLDAHRSLELEVLAEAKRDEREIAREAARAKYSLEGDEELEAVRIYTAALNEGGTVYRALSSKAQAQL